MRSEVDLSDRTRMAVHGYEARSVSKWVQALCLHPNTTTALLSLEAERRKDPFLDRYCKAVVEAMTTGNSALLLEVSRAFLQLVATRSVLGALDTLRVPLGASVFDATDVDDADFVAEGQPAPFRTFSFNRAEIPLSVIRFLVAFTKETITDQGEATLNFIEQRLVRRTARAPKIACSWTTSRRRPAVDQPACSTAKSRCRLR